MSPSLTTRNAHEVCKSFLFSRSGTTSATPTSPPPEATWPAACRGTGKRHVGILQANRTAQYLRGRVPASNAGADLGGYRKKMQQLIQICLRGSLQKPGGKPLATPFPPNVPKPAMISTKSTRHKPTKTNRQSAKGPYEHQHKNQCVEQTEQPTLKLGALVL